MGGHAIFSRTLGVSVGAFELVTIGDHSALVTGADHGLDRRRRGREVRRHLIAVKRRNWACYPHLADK